MPSLGPLELVIVFAIVIVIFGAGRVADLGGALGRSIREFRNATSDPTPAAARPPGTTSAHAPRLTDNAPGGLVCPGCGLPAAPSAQFCGSCGQRLREPAS